jgi:hypothetical protein
VRRRRLSAAELFDDADRPRRVMPDGAVIDERLVPLSSANPSLIYAPLESSPGSPALNLLRVPQR